jgi:hypothetical protein
MRHPALEQLREGAIVWHCSDGACARGNPKSIEDRPRAFAREGKALTIVAIRERKPIGVGVGADPIGKRKQPGEKVGEAW